jgi:hypothetical protein
MKESAKSTLKTVIEKDPMPPTTCMATSGVLLPKSTPSPVSAEQGEAVAVVSPNEHDTDHQGTTTDVTWQTTESGEKNIAEPGTALSHNVHPSVDFELVKLVRGKLVVRVRAAASDRPEFVGGSEYSFSAGHFSVRPVGEAQSGLGSDSQKRESSTADSHATAADSGAGAVGGDDSPNNSDASAGSACRGKAGVSPVTSPGKPKPTM